MRKRKFPHWALKEKQVHGHINFLLSVTFTVKKKKSERPLRDRVCRFIAVSHLSRSDRREAAVRRAWSPRRPSGGLAPFPRRPSPGRLCWCAAPRGLLVLLPLLLPRSPHPPPTWFPRLRRSCCCSSSRHPLFRLCILFLQLRGLWRQLWFL